MIFSHRFIRPYRVAIAILSIGSAAPAVAVERSIDYIINPYQVDVVDSWLFDINSIGRSTGYQVIHHAGGGFPQSAITYRAGDTQVVASGNSGSSYSLTGFAINNFGDVVGNVDDLPYFFSSGGVQTPIESPGSSASLFVAGLVSGGVNDSGNVLISIFPNDPVDTPPAGFSGLALWSLGGASMLSALNPLYPYVNPPDPNDFNSGPSSSSGTSSVTHLNNANQFAAGIHRFDFDPVDPDNFDDDLFTESFTNAYIYDGLGNYYLLVAPTPDDELRPIDIDDDGTVFGWAGSSLALWGPDGSLQSVLPNPAIMLDDVGYNGFPTVQRNNLGQVVGVTVDGGVLCYDPTSNAWTDVTPTIDGLGTGTFSTIQGFNDRGQFVGLARPPQGGGVFGYVVSPVPEPSSLAIGIVGLWLTISLRMRVRVDRLD